MPAHASIFVKVFQILPREILHDQYICGLSPSPTYRFHPEDSPEVYAVPLGSLIEDVPIMMLSFIRNMKIKLVVGEVFVLFLHTESSRNVKS